MIVDTVTGQMLIETARFLLRPLRASDVGLLELFAGDQRVAEMTRSIPHPLPPGAIDAFIARSLAPDRVEDVWAMDGSAGGLGEFLGVVGLERMDRGQSEIGYWVAPPYWNAHIASEAVEALIAANPQNCQTLFASVFQDNPASARVLTNAGFAYIGDAEAFAPARGRVCPTWTYLRTMGRVPPKS